MWRNPISVFKSWHKKASSCQQIGDANAMTLATCGENMFPSARMVLLKGVDDQKGFSFFTNKNSHKANQLYYNSKAALLFYWEPLHRQIRVEGIVEEIREEDSDEYFATRPRLSQLGAHASMQSQTITKIPDDIEDPMGYGRHLLQERIDTFNEQYPETVPRPKHWGGFVLKPLMIEFWEQGNNRLHNRVQFTRSTIESLDWKRKTLYP
eukprot:gb/GECH01009344.1/.p1 GENE.gb/GECH01009344.1/~~gb/GECH01009344.1/.p1  ORF type:complete len:209 (+),score=47.50 gb/GECH01009344.1/:1-627(+)